MLPFGGQSKGGGLIQGGQEQDLEVTQKQIQKKKLPQMQNKAEEQWRVYMLGGCKWVKNKGDSST